MAVTKHPLHFIKDVSHFLVCLALAGCAVDMGPQTPGASTLSLSCSASTAGLTAFEPVLNNILQTTANIGSGKQGCGNCHNSNASNAGKNVFTVFPGTTSGNSALVLTNYCAVAAKGKKTATHPQLASHSGGQYSSTDIQALVDFVNTYIP